MKIIFMILVFNALLLSDNSAAEDYSFKKDKQKHLAISAMFAIGSETILEAYNKHSRDESNRLNGVELIPRCTVSSQVPPTALVANHDANNPPCSVYSVDSSAVKMVSFQPVGKNR